MKAKYIAVLGIVILIIVGVLALQVGGKLSFPGQWLRNLNPFKSQPSIVTISDAIITDITRVKQLTTTIYTIQQLVKKEGGSFASKYRMIMVVKGTVEAGIDLTQLDAADVSRSPDGESITVTLPPVIILTEPSQILSTDRDDTYMFDFSKQLLSDVDKFALETQIRSEAGGIIIQTACTDGILMRATADAHDAIERLMKTTQPDLNIMVESAPVPSVDECKANIPTD